MAVDPDEQAGQQAPRYTLRFTQTLDAALDAGRLAQAGFLRTYYAVFGAGIAIGLFLLLVNVSIGVGVLLFSALMLLTTYFALPDRLFGRRRVRSMLDQPIGLDFADDGIVWHGPTGTSRILWSSLTEVRTNERCVIFMRDRVLIAYAPATAFATTAERDVIVRFSRDRIAAAKADAPSRGSDDS